ncbi:MAG: NlpC/P60 family protein [Lachnospiraceae bacterium]
MKKRSILLILAMAFVLLLGAPLEGMSQVQAEEQEKVMYVAVRNINLHKDLANQEPNLLIPYREQVIVTGRKGGWVILKYQGESYYYYMGDNTDTLQESLPEPNFTGNNEYQQAALSIAKKIYEEWDTAYGHKASNGEKAPDGKYYFDCSGFASYVMDQAMQNEVPMYNLSANIETLYNTTGICNKGLKGEINAKVVCEGTFDESKLQPGDVLFFNVKTEGGLSSRGYNHCGIYLGNGEMIHSSSSFDGKVRTMPIDSFYQEGFAVAKRYLPEKVSPANKKHWAAASTTKIYVNKDSDGKVLKTISLMDTVTVLYTDNNNWAYVKLSNGKKGYTLIKNLCSDLSGKGITCKVRNSGLKLYKKANKNSKSITLSAGKKVSLRGKTGNYYKVKYQGSWYYIYAPGKIADKLTTY